MATTGRERPRPSTEATLTDDFWAPRLAQLRSTTLDVIAERLEEQGAFDNLRRLVGRSDAPRRAMHFSDSDVYKWAEAAALAGEPERIDELLDLLEGVQQPDGYVHSHYATPGGPARYTDLDFGHEHYCFGHLIEAAVSHHEATDSDRFLAIARNVGDHLVAHFGADGDERTDAHPEVELALCRLSGATGEQRYLDQAARTIERRLAANGTTLETHRIGGHAVRALYLASGIAEVALATGDPRWKAAAERLFAEVVTQHAYPTGAVGGRWLGEAVGKPYEQPDAMAYAESCAAVAAAQLSWRMWQLTRDPAALDHLELVAFNALPASIGADGASWFYSQPHAVDEVAADFSPWVYEFDYGMLMLREWFPARRHRWFDVPCCPANVARAFASVPRWAAEVDDDGDLLVHLPVASRVRGGGWDVTIAGGYPIDGEVAVTIHAQPAGAAVRVRRPGWAGGGGHVPLAEDGRASIPIDWEWWTTSHRVSGGDGLVHLRRGPIVHCLDGADHPDVDLRDVVVDPDRPIADAFALATAPATLHHPLRADRPRVEPVALTPRPYATWGNEGPSTLRTRFPTT